MTTPGNTFRSSEEREAGATQKMTQNAQVTDQTSSVLFHSQGVRKLGEILDGSSLDLMREALMQSDSDVLTTSGEELTNDDFILSLPIKTPEVIPSLVPIEIELERYHKIVWYPNLGKKTVQGIKTADYIKLLSQAEISYAECFNLLQLAERLVKDLGCSKSETIWKKLSPLLRYLNATDLPEAACKIAMLLHYSPDKVDQYISGIMVLKPYVHKDLTSAVTTLEKKVIELMHMIEVMVLQSRLYIEEANKQVDQVSKISKNLGGLQEILEQTTMKVFRLNLLLSSSEDKPCCS